MQIPKRRRQEVNPRRQKLIRHLGRRQHALQLRRILDPILAALHSPRLRLRRNAPRMAIRNPLLRLFQILALFVVAHVDHDAVEGIRHVGRALDDRLVLRVVQVQDDGHGRRPARVGDEVHEEAVGVGDGPGEEQDLHGRPLGFGGAHDRDNGLEVVLGRALGFVLQGDGGECTETMPTMP